jgi:hypothetical protein
MDSILVVQKQLVSEEDTFLLLSKGDMKAETESETVAAQDQALQTKYNATTILETETGNSHYVKYMTEK